MKRVAILTFSTLFAYLGGCAPLPPKPPTTVLPPIQTEGPATPAPTVEVPAESQGDHLTAAREYSQLASAATIQNKLFYQLRMAENLLLGGYLQPAREALEDMPVTQMSEQQLISRNLLLARIALQQREPKQVLTTLRSAPAVHVDAGLRRQFYQLSAEAYQMLGNHLEFAKHSIRLEPLLENEDKKKDNHQAIWQSLSQLNTGLLMQLRTAPPPDHLSGWLELSHIGKTFSDSPETVKIQLDNWLRHYPGHPAQSDIYQSLLNRKFEQPISSRQIAYLLPLSGNFAYAGNAIRDGVMASYYQSQSTNKSKTAASQIRFYDTTASDDIVALYDQAVADGASVVLGPLQKNLVNQLLERGTFSVPTISLNYADSNQKDTNLFQLSLLPEDEAHQVADRIWQDGYQSVAIISPKGAWGDRLLNAFQSQWQIHKNINTEVYRYESKSQGIANGIQNVLGIDSSKLRRADLSRLLGRGIKFSERKRKDIDAIFVAGVSSKDAAQIRPQLKYFGADDIPVYATSHIYSANINKRMLRDMDGILFCDMPWMLNSKSKEFPLRQQLQKTLNIEQSRHIRLYALGVDTYKMLPALRNLQVSSVERFEGVTGYLSVDKDQRIVRKLEWAYIERSAAIPFNERVIEQSN